MKQLLLLASLIAFVGCASSSKTATKEAEDPYQNPKSLPFATFTKTGNSSENLTQKEPTCEFAIYRTAPQEKYDELGIIEFKPQSFSAARPRDINEMKASAQRTVCKVGGNGLILGDINGVGNYMNATVIYVYK